MSASFFFPILPEIWISLLAILLLGLDLILEKSRVRLLPLLACVGLFPAVALLTWQWSLGLDPVAIFFKGIFLLSGMAVLLMLKELSDTLEKGHGEFALLILTATLGMCFTASSNDFLMLFVSLELITISFYVMTAYLKTDIRSVEAGLKYLILGSVASGFFLYGIAFVYGATGSVRFAEIRSALQGTPSLSPGMLFGLLLILGGIVFKVASVPFHLWVPDVYQGAPTPVTAFLSVGSKSAGFLVALRVFYELFLPNQDQWTWIVAILAGLTILYGNLGAIPQTNIKRLLGYSSIGHAGYILIGIAAGSPLGSASVNFYLASYLVTNLAAFLVVAAFSRHSGSDEIADYAGLSQRAPFLAAVMFVSLLSLAGIPPLAGFFGKFLLLLAAVREGYLWLAIVGAAAVVISLYFYLLIVKRMYMDAPSHPAPIPVSFSMRIALSACVLGIVGIGIWQGPFVQLSFASVKPLF